jgi:hypothetical protein
MSYTIQNDWARKDALAPAAAGKVISGTHFYNEFVAVQNEFNNKANKAGDSGQAFESLTQTKSTNDNKVATTEYVQTELVDYDTKLAIMQAIYPVGSIFTTVSDSTALATTPAEVTTLMGFGTWAAFGAGKVPLGIDSTDTDFDTAGSSTGSAGSGGTKTHELSEAEMPVHKHIWCGDDQLNINGMNNGISEYGGAFSYDASSGASGDGNYYNTSNTGSGDAHNNMPPYITVYMWKRTA